LAPCRRCSSTFPPRRLRRGEALALHWSDIDLTNGYLTVRGTLTRTRAGLKISSPKTERSRRTIPLVASTVATLVGVRDAQQAERKRAGSAWHEHHLVFSTETGSFVDPRNAFRAITSAAKRAGLHRVGLHTLRHTAASIMIEAAVPLKTVSEILGHTSIQVTGDIYGHVSTEGARAAMERLSTALGWEQPPDPKREPR
jgi:integrase